MLSASQLRRIDAVDEQVGVEAGFGDEGKDAAGGRIDRDQCAALVAESLLRHFLQLDVQRQHQIVARRGGGARQGSHAAAGGVHLDLLVAGAAVQFVLVALFQPGLADVIRALVIGAKAFVVDAVGVALVDAADVADHVRGDLVHRVLAEQARLDVDAGKAVTVDGEFGHLLVGEARADRHAVGSLGFDQQALEADAIARADLDDRLPARRWFSPGP